MAMVLKKEEFEEGIGVILKCTNTDVLEDMQQLAAVLKDESDNTLLEQAFEACKTFQSVYNDSFKPSIDGLIRDFKNTFDITEMIEKASVGSVSKIDAGFKNSGIDAGSVNL